MTVMVMTDKHSAEDSLKDFVIDAINYLIYPTLLKNRNAIDYLTFTAGRQRFRDWGKLSYKRLLSPCAIKIDFVNDTDIDNYLYEIDDKDTIKGDILFTQYDYMIPVFNTDYTDHILTDLMSNAVLDLFDRDYRNGFASLAVFNTLVSMFEEKNKLDKPIAKKAGRVKPFAL